MAYTSPLLGRSKIEPRADLDRVGQGASVRNQFEGAVEAFSQQPDPDFVYLVFRSAPDFLLDLEKLDKGDFRLAAYKEVPIQDAEGATHIIYEAAVYLNRSAIAQFLRKVEDYLKKDTPITYNPDGTPKGGGNPLNLSLIANIDEIRQATLKSFWQEPEAEFPHGNVVEWWEVWFCRDPSDAKDNPVFLLNDAPLNKEILINERQLLFPEHYVLLIKATAEQLAQTILYSNRLAEIRKPRDTADFFTYLDIPEQQDWLNDLIARTDHIKYNEVAVCVLDTGLNNAHPLLAPLVPNRNVLSVNPAWTTADRHGHGTGMSGLALYGDLTDALGTAARVTIFHHLESVKLIEVGHAHPRELYGAVTIDAVAQAEVANPTYKRAVCMAVTCPDTVHHGRPSSWSSAIDQILFGSIDDPNARMVFLISSGNVPLADRINYPLINDDFSVNDPAQSFNAIAVGAYTLKDQIDLGKFPSSTTLAIRGSMSPCNTTSLSWDNEWCRKPDIVMEGGNSGLQNAALIEPDSLQLLTTSSGGIGRQPLTTFGDTSGATALASKFAAELYAAYPHYWPETIRALMIHSSDWTTEMLNHTPINQLNQPQKIALFSKVGYGVPNLAMALQSASNSLCLVTERDIKPYKKEHSRINTDEFHLIDLPWPTDELQRLFNVEVKLKITLSYFIEPNPGSKQYEKAGSYRSHGLRFKMLDSGESLNAFKARVSSAMRTEDTPYLAEGGEHWILGNVVRDKGSLHKDIWIGSAVDLATRDKIAIYPVGGWWKTRKKHERWGNRVRYSLIVSIETPDIDGVDIYTPVQTIIDIDILL